MAFFKKIDRAFVYSKEQADKRNESMGGSPVELEKGDRWAMFLSALMVFGPIFLLLFALLWLVFSWLY